MAIFDIIVSIASVVLAGVTIAYMAYLAPERLRRFIANAPYHLLDKNDSEQNT